MPKKSTKVKVSLAEPASNFKFDIRQMVKIIESDETGTIHGRAEYAAAENNYLVRYRQSNGVATEAWWQENALMAA